MLKFQVLPEKLGQVVRRYDDSSDNVELIVTGFPDNDAIECVSLREFQRNSTSPENVSKGVYQAGELTVIADSLEKYVLSWNNTVARPRSLKAYFIENLEDVRQYFRDMHAIYDSEFHPDDNFTDFTDEDGSPTFKSDEAEYLNSIMVECFNVCDRNGIEIYDVAGEVQIEIWRQKGIWPN